MKQESNPIKRSVQLAPLSREHHDGLLFAWKIKQGLEKNASIDTMRKYTLWYWKHHIKPHFYQEEKILIPYLPEGNPMGIRLKDEHSHIRELIIEIDAEADKRHLQLLCDLITQHIRFEERELFVYLEELLKPDQLDQVLKELEEHPLGMEEWKDEFWIKK
jgi:hemerythrin-like domain-containing protein